MFCFRNNIFFNVNIYNDTWFNAESIIKKKINYDNLLINEIENLTKENKENKEILKAILEEKKQLKWIIPVSVVSALLLSFIVFKVVTRLTRKNSKK